MAEDSLKIAFIGNPEGNKQQKLIKQTQQWLKNRQISTITTTQSIDEFYAQLKGRSDYDIIVAIGNKVSNRLDKQPTGIPTISIFISSMGYVGKSSPQSTTIFIDQPASRYTALIKEVTPHSKTISLLYSDDSEPFYRQLLNAAKQQGFNINGQKISKESDVYTALDHTVQESDILLAIPDSNIYNRRTIKTIFLTSYQNEVPIIGFSNSYTKAGAISSLHSSVSDVSKQLSETIVHFIQNNGTLPATSYPNYFHISTNNKVANSLSITLETPEILQKNIMAKSQ